MKRCASLLAVFILTALCVAQVQATESLQPGGFSQEQLTQMSEFLSNFTELGFMNFDLKTSGSDETMHLGGDPSNPHLISFGIMHNRIKNKSRISQCVVADSTHGSWVIDAKYVAESVKEFFDIDLKHKSVDQSDRYYFDGALYYFSVSPDGNDCQAPYHAEVKQATQEGDVVRMTGDIYDIENKKARPYTFEATAKPYKWNGKDTWTILSLKCTGRWFLTAALDFVMNHKLPDGEVIGKEECDGNFADNALAFCDVDGDGKPELLVRFTSGSTASQQEFVCGFDEKTGKLTIKFIGTPGVEYFKNGCAKEKASHNQGLAGDFWPYSFSTYNAKKGKYEQKGSVDAWSKKSYPTNPFENDMPFPEKIDVTGDGFVYFIDDASFNGAKGAETPVDTPVYEAWVKQYIGDAEPIKVEWVPATIQGIQVLEMK